MGKEWQQFVQNRVNQIRSSVQMDVWKHFPGVENPADLPSRGTNLSDLIEKPYTGLMAPHGSLRQKDCAHIIRGSSQYCHPR